MDTDILTLVSIQSNLELQGENKQQSISSKIEDGMKECSEIAKVRRESEATREGRSLDKGSGRE